MSRFERQLKLAACALANLIVSSLVAFGLWRDLARLFGADAPGPPDAMDLFGSQGLPVVVGWMTLALLTVMRRLKPRRVPRWRSRWEGSRRCVIRRCGLLLRTRWRPRGARTRWKSRWEGSRRWAPVAAGLASGAGLLWVGGDGLELLEALVETARAAAGPDPPNGVMAAGVGSGPVLTGGLLLAGPRLIRGVLRCLEALFVPEILLGPSVDQDRPLRAQDLAPDAARTPGLDVRPRRVRVDRKARNATGGRPSRRRLWDAAGRSSLDTHPQPPRAARPNPARRRAPIRSRGRLGIHGAMVSPGPDSTLPGGDKT